MSTITQDTIRQFASESTDRIAFYQQFLPLAVEQTGALSAIAWVCDSKPYRPICQIQSQHHDAVKIGVSQPEHLKLMSQAVDQRQSLIIQPNKQPDTGTPSDSKTIESPVILLSSICRDDSVELIELFYAHGLDDLVYDEKSRALESLCKTVAECKLDRESATTPLAPNRTANRISPSQLDEYVHQIHRSLDPVETAKQITNEARRLLDCDRVSVVEWKSNHGRITAISGQPSVNNRSNTVALIRNLCKRVLPTRNTFWYPTEKQLPVEIETPLQEYLAHASTRSLVIIPIFDQPPEIQERPDPVESSERLIGGLIIEHCAEQWSRDSVSQAVDITARHAADAYRNAYHHRQLLFYPIWKWLGKSRVVLAARNLRKSIAATIGLVGLALVLAFWPAQLKVSCDGVVVPATRSNVFAPIDGTVAEIKVTHGANVSAGDTLVQLVNLELETQAAELAGKIRELERDIQTTETLALSRDLEEPRTGEQNLNAQKEELASYLRQQSLVDRKLQKLKVVSPLAGQVVTWNLEDRFKMRPVSRGDLLMEIVDVEGAWQLELNMPDQEVGRLMQAQASSEKPLAVEFILAADPDRQLSGELIDIGRSTEIAAEQGQTVRLKVRIDVRDLDIRQAKSGVTANVICGKTSLGNSLFLGVKEFLQKHWFRLF